MIQYTSGNMFDASVDAIVNTVNLVGVMGKGVALQFKERFKDNFKLYCQACKNQSIGIGNSLVTSAQWHGRDILIINFPTKVHWRNPSKLEYVEKGLDNLKQIIAKHNIKSIAIPPLGAGNGGLDWADVKCLIEEKLTDVDCDIQVFEPGHKAVSLSKKIKLTPARALLTYMLSKLQQEGMDATNFSAVKLIYFMQKFGARDIFRLSFVPYTYGPYCSEVSHMLHAMDGAYVTGFADMNKRPFEPFDVIKENLPEVIRFVECDIMLKDVADRTCHFLNDNWDDFSLELLSSVDYLMAENPKSHEDEIHKLLCAWNPRKARLFSNPNLTTFAVKHIETQS